MTVRNSTQCRRIVVFIGFGLCCGQSVLYQLSNPPLSCLLSGNFRVNGDSTCAGINRHVVGDARAPQERRKRLHPDL